MDRRQIRQQARKARSLAEAFPDALCPKQFTLGVVLTGPDEAEIAAAVADYKTGPPCDHCGTHHFAIVIVHEEVVESPAVAG